MQPSLVLDDDVYEKLREHAERSGRPLREIANENLRRVLSVAKSGPHQPFVVRPRAMGKPASAAGYDDIPELLDSIEGAERR